MKRTKNNCICNCSLTKIPGVELLPLDTYKDNRGSLTELWRKDWKQRPSPSMCYMSCTNPKTIRGPHVHKKQTDTFIFFSGTWVIRLWYPTIRPLSCETVVLLVKDQPYCLIVPPTVVHAYANVETVPNHVLNMPDKLYKGRNKKSEVDEIRYEGNTNYPVKDMLAHPIQGESE